MDKQIEWNQEGVFNAYEGNSWGKINGVNGEPGMFDLAKSLTEGIGPRNMKKEQREILIKRLAKQ